MSKYFPSYLSELSGIKQVTVNLGLEGVPTKKDFESIAHADTSSFALKTSLTALKTEVEKLDIPKLSTVPADLAKLTKEVQEDFTKKTDFFALDKKVTDNKTGEDSLETKVDNNHLTAESSIDLTKYVLKSSYDDKIGNLDLRIPDVSGLLQTSTFNSKVGELQNKIKTAENKPHISNLVNNTELKNVENKIPDSNAFVKKTDWHRD